MSEPVLSKYAAKKRARALADAAMVLPEEPESLRVAVEVTLPARKAEEDDFADLGKLPGLCAAALERAVAELEKAGSVAAEMVRLAGPGVQRQEPLGIRGACASAARKFRSLAKRAARVQ